MSAQEITEFVSRRRSHNRHRIIRTKVRVLCVNHDHGLQTVLDFFKTPRGNILQLKCGCRRPESATRFLKAAGKTSADDSGACERCMSQQFETPNSFVASFLNYCGLVLIDVKSIGPKSVAFVFDDPNDEAKQLVEDFWNDAQVTSARKLLQADREIRKHIWQHATQERKPRSADRDRD